MADTYEKIDDSKVKKTAHVEVIINVNALKRQRDIYQAQIDKIDATLLEAKKLGVEPT